MDERIERQTVFKRADVLVRKVLAISKSWPAQEKAVFNEIRRNALLLPGMVAAALLRENEEAIQAGLERALEVACNVEYLVGLAKTQTAGEIKPLANEAREALTDHIAAMKLG